MTSESERYLQQYLQDVDYPASKDDLVSAAKGNDAPYDFIKGLVDLPITEYSDPERVRQALEGLRPSQGGSEDLRRQVGREEALDDLRERVMEAIQAEWDKTRRPSGVGTVDSKDVYERLVAEGVDVPRGAMESVLEKLREERRISGAPYHAPMGIAVHGAWSIIEPAWKRL